MTMLRFYRIPALGEATQRDKFRKLQNAVEDVHIVSMETELCIYVETRKGSAELTGEELNKLRWILTVPFQEDRLSRESFLDHQQREKTILVEIGPRLNFSTAFSTNAVSICNSIGLKQIERFEVSTRYLIFTASQSHVPKDTEDRIVASLHDRMTQTRYVQPIETFALNIKAESYYEVDILGDGRQALKKTNDVLGLAMDDWDLDFYTNMFKNQLKRNPTSVECFDLAQSNSEHSRHWFFRGKLVIDGKELKRTLFDMVIDTQKNSNQNNVIKFSDNSSAIEGFTANLFVPKKPQEASQFEERQGKRHIIFTAETHNFPTGVAPFSGSTTGTGGRIRDVQGAGRGGHVIAGTAGYSFGNLLIPGYDLPWEDKTAPHPRNFASAVEICVEASNGASDYGNKFGEPLIVGFTRSFGMKLSNGERREWIKPIMFSGGIGAIDAGQITKEPAKQGMEVVKIGGPVYRIGVGGGSASSVQVQGDNKEELDFGAVQRGDPEMEQKLNRVIRACLESVETDNPIRSIHDQGAGGNGNVLKEISEPAGAVIFTKSFQLGDPTISTLECWGAEYQESDAVLISADDKPFLSTICKREKCPVDYVGEITGNGKIVLVEGERTSVDEVQKSQTRHPVDLDLEFVLGKMPQKIFSYERDHPVLKSLELPSKLTVDAALDRVLRLPSVASKRFLTNKVDRSVTGLVAQQQCVGPLHTPLADVAVIALSFFETVGGATSIGEQPIKGLLDAAVGARMSVAEAVTNLMFANITSLQDVKCSGNWMWAAKLPGEGAALYDACDAMSVVMSELGIAVDGGKDSLSMAARVGEETVKAPGTLVVSAYAPCPDIRKTVTPDLKCPNGKGALLHVSVESGKWRLGGTALAQCFNQLGNESPDLEHPKILRSSFEVTQKLLRDGKIYAGHDVSDGGLVTCILEMAFAGNCGLSVDINGQGSNDVIEVLFAEEVGWVLEVDEQHAESIVRSYRVVGASCQKIGVSGPAGHDSQITVDVNGTQVLNQSMFYLRNIWEDTSFQLERLQATPECVAQEEAGLATRKSPPYKLTFDPNTSPTIGKAGIANAKNAGCGPRVAVLREEGINGDRELAASLHMAGFQVWDVTMTDLAEGHITLDQFQGLIFPGGFSYADVLGSARGWAAGLLFDKTLQAQLEAFKNRPDTFSLGICNGCQLMGILGWVAPDQTSLRPSGTTKSHNQGVSLSPNLSSRFESRFVTVKVDKSPSIMFRGMQGSVLGVWVAHGEGRFEFKNSKVYEGIRSRKLVSLSYVDDNGNSTTMYPLNPNGSPGGLAGLCSEDGRHLALMPHPERCALPWQWPWMPLEWRQTLKTSPWLRMFENAYDWCCTHSTTTTTTTTLVGASKLN